MQLWQGRKIISNKVFRLPICNERFVDDLDIIEEEISSENTPVSENDKAIGNIDDEENKEIPQIPLIKDNNNTKSQVKINSTIDDHLFIGFDFPRETCITFYNIVSNWLNKRAMMSTLGL